MEDQYIIIGVGAGVIILALVTINIVLICWVCKKNKESNNRLSTLSSERRCRLVQNTPRRSQTRDNVKYVTTKPAKQTKPKRKTRLTAKSSNNKPNYGKGNSIENVSDGSDNDEVFSTLHMVNRDSEPSNTEYGHVRLMMKSGEYDTACFRKITNDPEVDSMYARVDKNYLSKEDNTYDGTRSVAKNKTLVSGTVPDFNPETVHYGTLSLCLSDSKSSIKVTNIANGGSVDDVTTATDSIAVFDEKANETVVLVDKTNNINPNIMPYETVLTSQNVPTIKIDDTYHDTYPNHLSEAGPQVMKSIDLQTDSSFLKTTTGNVTLCERQSACTQVTDDDFCDEDVPEVS